VTTTDPAELRRRLRDDLGIRPNHPSSPRCDECGTHYAVAAGRCPDHTLDDQEVATMPESTPTVRTGTMNIVTGETKMDDGKPPASPLTTDGRQASVVAIEAAARLRGAPSGKPDPKPAGKTTGRKLGSLDERAAARAAKKQTKTGRTTTTVKPATTKEADKKTTAQPNTVGRAKTPEQRAATQAKNQATRIKTSVAAAIKAGTVERNAITTDVAKDGNVARVAKDNGLSVDDVLARIKPGAKRASTPSTEKGQKAAATRAQQGDRAERDALILAVFDEKKSAGATLAELHNRGRTEITRGTVAGVLWRNKRTSERKPRAPRAKMPAHADVTPWQIRDSKDEIVESYATERKAYAEGSKLANANPDELYAIYYQRLIAKPAAS
jgi:hypothetical protein